MPKRIDPRTDPEEVGDLVSPWDLWLQGELATEDLPEDEQEAAREIIREAKRNRYA